MRAIRGKILIIEDEVLVAVNYKDCLENLGFTCKIAHKIQDAYHFIKSDDYSLVFCDHDLSDGKGLDLIKKIKDEKPDLKFVYMTAATSNVLSEAATIQQISHVLKKPVSEKTILETLNELNIEPKKDIKIFIGADERKMILEIHKDGRTEKNS